MIRRPPRSTLFPTRRSSDLCGAVAWDGLSDEQREIRELVRSLARERIAPRAAEIDKRGEFPWDMVELMREHELDRKSTRLNSSHANISYAVFCLKKKKKIAL